MCGRYTLTQTSIEHLASRFQVSKAELEQLKDELHARYNIGPGQHVPVIIEDTSGRHIRLMRWGFLPVWAKELKDGYRFINARDDSVFRRPMWKHAILHSRCIIPTDGFYEWQKRRDGLKYPFRIFPKNQSLFSFAGVCNLWRDGEGRGWDTFAIVTTGPNKEMETIHNRMPVMLSPEDENRWLDPIHDTPESLMGILHPYEDGMLEIYEVSRNVNTTRADDESLIHPINSQ